MAHEAPVFLGLGSNLGDRVANLRRALALLSRSLSLNRVSSLYETEPWGYTEQPRFLNLVCQAKTPLSPEALLRAAQEVERTLGRAPTLRYGPRVVDVDLLAYGDGVVELPELVIPHPRLEERAFVLAPWAEIAPQWVHPRLGQTIAALLEAAPGREGVRLWNPPSGEGGKGTSE